MHKGAMDYIARVLFQRVAGLGFFLLGSRGIFIWNGTVYFLVNFVVSIISLGIMYKANPETLSERRKAVTDSPIWDKVLLSIYWPLEFFLFYIVAGYEARGAQPSPASFWTGIALFVFASVITVSALLVNTYLESTARIQTDRGQEVVTHGVYSVVRHPTYTAVLLGSVVKVMVFSGTLVWVASLLIALIIICRTYLEDRMLFEDLPGYKEYSEATKYRLVPFVW